MRTIVLVLSLSLAFILTAPSCTHSANPPVSAGSAVSAAGTCEVDAVEQVVKEDGVSIAVDIFSAVSSGGSTLAKLFTDLVAEFGEPTVACAANLVADLTASPPSTSGSGNMKLAPPSPGRAALLAEIDRRGWHPQK